MSPPQNEKLNCGTCSDHASKDYDFYFTDCSAPILGQNFHWKHITGNVVDILQAFGFPSSPTGVDKQPNCRVRGFVKFYCRYLIRLLRLLSSLLVSLTGFPICSQQTLSSGHQINLHLGITDNSIQKPEAKNQLPRFILHPSVHHLVTLVPICSGLVYPDRYHYHSCFWVRLLYAQWTKAQ